MVLGTQRIVSTVEFTVDFVLLNYCKTQTENECGGNFSEFRVLMNEQS
jgi:hypothetical protein